MKIELDKSNDLEPLSIFSMVSVYSKADVTLLKEFSNILHIVNYEGLDGLRVIEAKSITSVVVLILFILFNHKKKNPNICAQHLQSFIVEEKPFLDFTTTIDPLWQTVKEADTELAE